MGTTGLVSKRFGSLPHRSEHGHAHANWRLSLIPAESATERGGERHQGPAGYKGDA